MEITAATLYSSQYQVSNTFEQHAQSRVEAGNDQRVTEQSTAQHEQYGDKVTISEQARGLYDASQQNKHSPDPDSSHDTSAPSDNTQQPQMPEAESHTEETEKEGVHTPIYGNEEAQEAQEDPESPEISIGQLNPSEEPTSAEQKALKRLQEMLKEAQKKMQEAMNKVAAAQTEVQTAETDAEKQEAQLEAEAALVELASAQTEVSLISAQIMELLKPKKKK